MNPHQLNNPPISGGGYKTPIKRKGGAGHPGFSQSDEMQYKKNTQLRDFMIL